MKYKNLQLFRNLGLLLVLSTLIAVITATAVLAADSYPSKPVRLIIPFPPGGSNDIVGRLIAAKLSERLGKQVVVDNRGGAGGVLGSEMAAKAEPDGYTLLIVSAAYAFNPALYKLPFDPVKSFTPIAKLGSGPNSLTVHPSVPANSVKELIALAKQKPGQLICGCAGVGSFQHMGTELFKMMAGIDFKIVQFKGGGPAMIDLLGGHSQFSLGSLIQTLPHIQSGKFRMLGTGGSEAQRHPARCADDRGGRRTRVRSDQLVGDPRAGRHAGADRRQAEQGDQDTPGLGGSAEALPERRGGGGLSRPG